MRCSRYASRAEEGGLRRRVCTLVLDYPSKVVKMAQPHRRGHHQDTEIAQPEEVTLTRERQARHPRGHLLRVVEAIRSLPAEKRPKKLYGKSGAT